MKVGKLGMRSLVIAVVITLGVATTGVMSLMAVQDEETSVYVWFKDASPLIEGNDVKAGGVKVGTIDSIDVENGQAKLGLVLDDSVLPLHEDARAKVRPIGLLGERYVDLERGTPDAPVMEVGGTIPTSRTGRATDLDEVLNTVDKPTGTALAALVTTLGEGVRGHGGDLDAAIEALKPALTDTHALTKILDEQTGVLNELITSVEPVAKALSKDEGRKLDRLVGSAEKLLGSTSRAATDIDATLRELPSSLRDARMTLRSLDKAARSTTPNLRALRPTTSKLTGLSRELTAFSKATDPALKGLDPVLTQAEALIAKARPVAKSLSRQSPEMRRTVHHAKPVVNELLGNLRDVLNFVKYWALTTNGEDGLSHYFRAHLVVTDEIATGLVPGDHNDPDGQPETKPDTAAKPNTLLDGAGDLADPLVPGLLGDKDRGAGGLGDLLPGLGSGKQSSAKPRENPHGSTTGLSAEQESNLMNYLVGGGQG